MPDVSSVKDMVFSQTTIIQDRNWVELYKYFNENREYVDYNLISENMVDAIVAMEDQRYWTHWGLDPKWILRAGLSRFFPFLGDPGWWSTLTQQLLKNLLLNKDWTQENTKDKVVRKLKEMALTSKLSDVLKWQIIKEKWKMSKDELNRDMKKETLELYLNYISFGNNAYGVEAAAKTYFGVSAKDLSVLQSSILASLPKWPTYYNPFRYKDRMMGSLIITDSNGEKVALTWGVVKDEAIAKLSKTLRNSDLSNLSDNWSFTKFVKWLASFSIFVNGQNYKVEYEPWRKDSALARMYEDSYIDQSELKNAFIQWLDYKFNKHSFEIKAPHFVHWVIEELEKKYGKEALLNWGLVVKTTLDYNVQKIAESEIEKNMWTLEYYWANNESMVYVDSLNGDVLAYVWSADYFDEDIEWQNDMIRSPRQIGSSIKPLIYALWFMNLPLTIDTPMFDIPFRAGWNNPSNADWKFMWLMPLRQALAYSRNIPTIKIFLAMWEEVVKPALIKLWLTSLKMEHDYGYSLALWAGEIHILELAQWYMHISARWKPAKINPIMEVKSSEWVVLYKKEVEMAEQVLAEWVAYILWNILSDSANMPPGWPAILKASGLTMWVKSGTSNMKTKSWESRARDWMLVWFTTNKVAIFWWWNTDWSPMNRNAYGALLHSDSFRWFWQEILKNNYISSESMKWIDVANVTISKISGKIASAETPSAFKVQTLAYFKSVPTAVDEWMMAVELDKLCWGFVSPYTPESDIVNGYVVVPNSFMPWGLDLADIKLWWQESSLVTWSDLWITRKPNVIYNYSNIFIEEPKDVCESRVPRESDSLSAEILKPVDSSKVTSKFSLQYNVSSQVNIRNVLLYLDGEIIEKYEYDRKKSVVDLKTIDLTSIWSTNILWKHTLKVEVIDLQGYSSVDSISMEVVEEDLEPPALSRDKIKTFLQEDWTYEVVLLFEDELSAVEWWKILIDWVEIKTFEWGFVSFNISELKKVSYVVVDSVKNILKWDLDLTE